LTLTGFGFALTLSPFGLRSAGAALLSAGAAMAQSAVMTAFDADSQITPLMFL